jgi:hypothetical protein
MIRQYKILIFIILLVYIYFFTPQILSDSVYSLKFGVVQFIYKDSNKNLISFTFDHKDYDGKLMSYSIQEELVKYKVEKETELKLYNFKQHQYLNNKRILQYSKFTSSISNLLNEMITHQKRRIKVAIAVSVRNQLKDIKYKGNFIKLASVTLEPSDTLINICSKIHTSIKNTQQHKYFMKSTCISDIFPLYNIDYLFDSWRDLTSINTKNNGLLTRQSIDNVLEKDILDLKYKQQKSFIILDFLNNKFIISRIRNFKFPI